MKKRILWLGLSFLLVAALVLSSCGEAAPGEQEEEEEEEEEEADLPTYGGTLTAQLHWHLMSDPSGPSIGDGFLLPCYFQGPFQERPLIGDFETYGPRGNGEFTFQLNGWVPPQFMIGNTIESWDVSPEKVVWHVQPGIMWHDNKPHIMEARELVAEDIAADLRYFQAAPGGKSFASWTGEIYATSKYDLTIEFTEFNSAWFYIIGFEDRALTSPPETEGNDNWADMLGTGPFMLKEYVVGSHFTYERNPNYRKTTTIDGVEYQIPFIDELVWPIIPDESSQISALRTGMLELINVLPATHFADLDETAPELLSAKYAGAGGQRVILKCSEPPFDDIDVRRAMMIGTDMKAFADLQGVGELPIHWYPWYLGMPAIYIPMEDLPADIQILYDYDPELAMDMLEDAGHPFGTLKIKTYSASTAMPLDAAALLKDVWAKIGVEVEIVANDEITNREIMAKKEYLHTASYSGCEVGNAVDILTRSGETDHYFNYAMWSNERFDELCALMAVETDTTKLNSYIKEAGLIMLEEVPYIPYTARPEGHYWWPWIKNYYGECNIGDWEIANVLAYAWIDQDMKADMGY